MKSFQSRLARMERVTGARTMHRKIVWKISSLAYSTVSDQELKILGEIIVQGRHKLPKEALSADETATLDSFLAACETAARNMGLAFEEALQRADEEKARWPDAYR